MVGTIVLDVVPVNAGTAPGLLIAFCESPFDPVAFS